MAESSLDCVRDEAAFRSDRGAAMAGVQGRPVDRAHTSGELARALPRASQAPRIARRWLADYFAAELDSRSQETAELLVSELVTNAVVHGRGSIEIHAQLDADRLLVEVIDQGPGFTRGVGEVDPTTPGGCGLRIVEAEASRWGIREGAAHVWFELPRHPPGAEREAGGLSPDARRRERRPETRRSPLGRADRAALYRRVADTLERWAELAEQNAERERRYGHRQSARIELRRAKRARQVARHGRALCSRL